MIVFRPLSLLLLFLFLFMFVLQEEYSISENGRKFLGAVQTYLV